MAWKLRQFFEGDRTITVADVAATAVCWVDGSNVYVPNSIAIKINGVETLLSTVTLALGFLRIAVPPSIYITATTTIEVYAVCETSPDSHTLLLTAKPVNFQVTNGVIKACNPQVILNSDLDEYIRLYLTESSGDYFNAKYNGVNLALSNFSYQSGDTGNIAVASGNFSRPTTFATPASLISNTIYEDGIVAITPLSTSKYFTARFGYIEVIFSSGTLLYNNYMVASEFEASLGVYTTGDIITIEATSNNYVVRKNGTVLITKNKNIAYTVTGGTIVPSSSQVGVPVVWNVPSSAGTYTFTATLGDSIQFSKAVQLHSCADAVNDTFNGTYNTVYNGDVSINDVDCVGENTYFTYVASSAVGGTVVLNNDGTFAFTPTTNYNAVASFQYNIQCGSTLIDSEIVDTATASINYFNACNGVVANYVDSGNVRCQNCVEQKEQIDTNAQCTGNLPTWVSNVGGTACSDVANLVPTGNTRCNSCVNELEVQDLNPCSSTYQDLSWVENPNGTNCDVDPNWVDVGVFECQNCVEKKRQRDIKPCSPTYDQLRWVDNVGGTSCNRTAIWVDTDEFTCINCVEYKQQTDTNPCSPTFNQPKNVLNPGGNVCNTNPDWQDTDARRCFNGVHQKLQVATNECSQQVEQWVNTGLDVCSCFTQYKLKNNCVDNEIIAVEVYRTDVVESNRLIEYTDEWVKFKSDIGEYNYKIVLHQADGNFTTVNILNQKCNPVV